MPKRILIRVDLEKAMFANKGAQAKVEVWWEMGDRERVEGFSVEGNACRELETSRSFYC